MIIHKICRMHIHVGKLVLEKLRERGMKKAEFGRRINKSRQNVHSILRRPALDTDLLSQISKVLEYNFFQVLAEKLDIEQSYPVLMEEKSPYKKEKPEKIRNKEQLQSLARQLKQAEKEISYLKKINSLLDKKNQNLKLKKQGK
jgi:transcriptional regulator